MATAFTSSVCSIIFLLSLAAAHSNLGYPPAYSKQACKADTRCKTPCPPVRGNKSPAVTWERGQEVEIVWHKNNHIGGFYRRSLVPVKHMMDHRWHRKTAFDFGCWSQGTFICGNNERRCGGDEQKRAYRNKIKIPQVFPNGNYVFAQVWYGGLQWQKKAPKYADYYSCSFVRIQGGGPPSSAFKATFQPNPRKKTGRLAGVPMDKCATGSIRPNQCGGDACENKPIVETVPEEFLKKTPQMVHSALFKQGMNHGPIKDGPAGMVAETVAANKNDARADEAVAMEQQKELTTKKFTPAANILDEIDVMIGGKKVGTGIEDGQARIISYNGGQVRFQVVCARGASMRNVVIAVSGEPTKTQSRKPYTYLWLNPRLNQEVALSVRATTMDGNTATMKVKVTLMNSNRNRRRHGNGNRRCAKANEPQRPRGSWGPRGSPKWNKMRSMYWKRHEWCNRCRNC